MRALTADENGRLHPILSPPHAQTYLASGNVEQDAKHLLANILRCLATVAPQVAGLSNHGESCPARDACGGRPICPVISGQDDRTADLCARPEAEGAATLVMDRAGLQPDPIFGLETWLVHAPRAPGHRVGGERAPAA